MKHLIFFHAFIVTAFATFPAISSAMGNDGLTRSLTDSSKLASSTIKIFFPAIDPDSTNLVTQAIPVPDNDSYSIDSDLSDGSEPVFAESRLVSAFALHPKKTKVALGSFQNIWLVNQDTCKTIAVPENDGAMSRLGYNPEGTLLAFNISTGYSDNDPKGFTSIYNCSQNTITHRFDQSARELKFNGSGDKLVMIINEKVFLWDLNSNIQTQIMPESTIGSLIFSRIFNGNTFIQNFKDGDNNKSIIVWNSDNPSETQKTKIDPSYLGVTFGETTEQLLAYAFRVPSTDDDKTDFERHVQNYRKILIVNGELMSSAQIPQTLPNGTDEFGCTTESQAYQNYVYCPEIKKYFFINEEYSGDQLTTINLLDPQTCTVQELEAFDPKLRSFTFSDDGKRLLIDKEEYGVGYEYYIVNLIERYQDKL